MNEKLFIYYASYIAIPGLPFLAWLTIRRSGLMRYIAAVMLLGGFVLSYARFIEPRILRTVETAIDLSGDQPASTTLRVALFADPHIGIFGNTMPIERIVTAINAADVDIVLIAGDFTYWQAPEDLREDFAALSDLKASVFAVMGNHDVGFPGPKDIAMPLTSVLSEAGVTLLDNRLAEASVAGQKIFLFGASDLWEGRQRLLQLNDIAERPLFVLTHNPDTALRIDPRVNYDLMLAGHTHGGQIRLPFIYKRHIPTEGPFDKGLHVLKFGQESRQVYVTSGTGMVGLPTRLLMPPQVDILTIIIAEPPKNQFD